MVNTQKSREEILEEELNGYYVDNDKNESEMSIDEYKEAKEELMCDFDVHMSYLEKLTFDCLKTKPEVNRFVSGLIDKRLAEEN